MGKVREIGRLREVVVKGCRLAVEEEGSGTSKILDRWDESLRLNLRRARRLMGSG